MRPWGASRLKRRMNEIERALTATVGVLVMLLLVTSIITTQTERRHFAVSRPTFSVESLSHAAGRDEHSQTGPSIKSNIENVDSRETVNIVITNDANSKQGVSPKSEYQQKFDLGIKSIDGENENNGKLGKSDTVDADLFLPGSIQGMNRTRILHQCYIPSTVQLPIFPGCSISHKYKVIFHMTPKSGSSTGRHVIKNDFEGEDHLSERSCLPRNGENYIQLAVLRNPTTRAFAAYEEMFVRRLGEPELIPKKFRAFMEPFRGWIYKNYSALFDNVEGVRKLNDAYEKFMEVWDGTAFDMHLDSQVMYNVRKNRAKNRHDARHLAFVFDTHAMEESFEVLARMVNLGKKPRVIRGRSYPRRLNVSNVSDRAYQAMCRIYKDDYCCLNYELPPACLRDDIPKGQSVRCKWINVNGERLIQSVLV